MKDKFNLTEQDFQRVLKKRVNICPICGGGEMIVLITVGGLIPSKIRAKCFRCGHEVSDVHIIEAYGTNERIATVVTSDSLTKCLKSVLKRYKRKR